MVMICILYLEFSFALCCLFACFFFMFYICYYEHLTPVFLTSLYLHISYFLLYMYVSALMPLRLSDTVSSCLCSSNYFCVILFPCLFVCLSASLSICLLVCLGPFVCWSFSGGYLSFVFSSSQGLLFSTFYLFFFNFIHALQIPLPSHGYPCLSYPHSNFSLGLHSYFLTFHFFPSLFSSLNLSPSSQYYSLSG